MPLSKKDLGRALTHLEQGDWQAAHEIVQRDEESQLACWAHGIVHIMEGDIPNARYWYGLAKRELPAEPIPTAETRALRVATEQE